MLSFYRRFLSVSFLWLFIGISGVARSLSLSEQVAFRRAWRHISEKSQKRTSGTLTLWREASGGFVYVTEDKKDFVWVGGTDMNPLVLAYGNAGGPFPVVSSRIFEQMLNKSAEYAGSEDDNKVESVSPLLESVWVQDAPYNGLCPYYTDEKGEVSETRCKVGCVATAVSEVLRYHAYPEMLLDTLHGWSTPHYTLDTVLPGKRLDWGHMLDRYDRGYSEEEALAVQELSLYCGMACRMNYGVEASGSNIYRLQEPMQRVFGYRYAQFYDRSLYSPQSWNRLLQYELRRGIPLVYSGFNWMLMGHAFVIDGVDGNGLYHVRWGEEEGVYDGYFHIDVLNMWEYPYEESEYGRIAGMYCNQAALALFPDSLSAYPGDTLTYRATDIVVDTVEYQRTLNTCGYVPVKVTLTNLSSDTISYTLLMYRTETPDSVVWEEVSSLAMTTETLYPRATTDIMLYPSFSQGGTFHWGLTGDMEHILYSETVEVVREKRPTLAFGALQLLSSDAEKAAFRIQVSNESSTSSIATRYTYILRSSNRGDYPYKQEYIINLKEGATHTDTLMFHGLEPATEYTLEVEYDSRIRTVHTFTTPAATTICKLRADGNTVVRVYSMQGVLLAVVRGEELPAWRKTLARGCYLFVTSEGTAKIVYQR